MIDRLPRCPEPPEYQLPWDDLNEQHPWLASLKGCMQDAKNHGEGDVWTHTRMVCESMLASEQWRDLSTDVRQILFSAALLHDIAKPLTREEQDNGHVSFHGHSRRGSTLAGELLWKAGAPFDAREKVCSLVRRHLVPFHLLDRDDDQRFALEVAQSVRCDWLAIHARADAQGRICEDKQRMFDNVALFVERCHELNCLSAPYPFPTDHARFHYFQNGGSTPDFVPHENFRCEVVMMSGLPGVGKSTWIREHLPGWPVISLDQLREDMGVLPSGKQGVVLQRAKELARESLRSGRSFVWDATCLSRQVRAESLRLWASYNARVRIVYLEVPFERQSEQNRQRERPVPQKVIDKMLPRWEVPNLTEAHQVEWHVD